MILLAFLCVVLWLAWGMCRLFCYRYRSFAGRTVLVTGACSEVGRRLCVQLHAEGASIIAWDYSKLKLDELRREIVGGAPASATPTAPTLASRYSGAHSPLSHSAATAFSAAAGSTTLSGKSGSPLSPALRSPAAARAFFDTTAVDLSSRLQVRRAARELVAALALSHSAVDVVMNVAHQHPTRPMSERTEDSIETIIATNTTAPLLLASALCPPMLSRREGGHFVTFTAGAAGGGVVDAASPDYAGSQWGAAGAHYSIRAWLRHQHRVGKVPGEVRTTLVSLDAVRIGLGELPASTASPRSSLTTTASAAAAAVDASAAATLPLLGSGPSPNGSAGGPGSAGHGSEGAASTSLAAATSTNAVARTAVLDSAPAVALDQLVQRCLRAIGRGEESFTDSRRAWLAPVALALPVPWMSRVLDVVLWTHPKGERELGGGGKERHR